MRLYNKTSKKILDLIDELYSILSDLDIDSLLEKRNKQFRNIKQIVGHLIDSASNNTHRVIHLQYQNLPCTYPDYANLGINDKWIEIQNYNDENWNTLVQLFKYINLHYVHVISNINPEHNENEWISALNSKITLKKMIEDYPRHLRLHINEIIELIEA